MCAGEAKGFEKRFERPAIHIFAGEKVCIQVITPTHLSVALASMQVARIASGFLTTGFQTTRTGIRSGDTEGLGDLRRVLGYLS